MSDRVGQQVGNYRLVQLLGSGGFADVYLGKQIFLDSPAAIKLLHTNLVHEEIDGFQSEARTLVRLIHPNIIRILDFGLEGGTPFLVMDYAPNGNMRQLFPRNRRVPLAQVIEYVKQVANALQYAHDAKVIHRDVKPENLLLGRQNEILLSDFGIAVVAQSTFTQLTQEMTGTIAYMAPEQLQAHPRPASDQYSLAVVAYEWLSGSTPFTGSFAELAVKHMTVAPTSLREKLPELPPDVERVILTALSKEPAQRFNSVRAFATALEEASQDTKTLFSAPAPYAQTPGLLTSPITPILPILLPDAEQAPTMLNTAVNSDPVTLPGRQDVPTTVVAVPDQAYNPITPVPRPAISHTPAPERKGISRRTVIISGLAATGLIAVGGVAWEIVSHAPSPTTGTTITPTSTTKKSPSTQTTPTQTIPGLLEQDTFNRPDQNLWGTASDGTRWSGDANTSPDFSISNQRGRIHRTANGHSLYSAILGTAHPDAEILFTTMLDSFNNSHIGAMLRYTDDNHYYKVLLDGQSLHFLKRINPQQGPTIGQPISYSSQPQTLYTIRFRVSGTTSMTLQAKAWPTNTAEPSDWMITANDTDSTYQTGQGGLRPQIDQNVTLSVAAFQMTTVTG